MVDLPPGWTENDVLFAALDKRGGGFKEGPDTVEMIRQIREERDEHLYQIAMRGREDL